MKKFRTTLLKYNNTSELIKLDLLDESEKENILQSLSYIKIEDFKPQNFYDMPYLNAGFIFCPHRKDHFGVTNKYESNNYNDGIYDNLTHPLIKAETFLGSSNDDEGIQKLIDTDNIKNQSMFKRNELNLLVCTKAFGMGIDKPNIRYSVHINYPSSLESFIQESGRIGRDGKLSIAYVLFNKQSFEIEDEEIEIDKDILLYFIIWILKVLIKKNVLSMKS